VVERKPKWKPDLAHRGEVRWPKSLVYATTPERWSPLDLKLWVFLVSNLDTGKMWGEHTLHIRDVKKWSLATKSQILASMSRLVDDWIDIKTSPADLFAGATGRKDSFRVLGSCRLDGQQLCWTFSPLMITSLVDVDDGYARLHVEAVRRLRTFAGLRLYQVGCFTNHSNARHHTLTWEPPERFVDGVMADLKDVGVFWRCRDEERRRIKRAEWEWKKELAVQEREAQQPDALREMKG
jgi:hypothetical protein